MRRKSREPKIGDRIAKWRHRRGHSQAMVARRAGIDPSYLSRIETGRVHPTVRMAMKIAAALRVSLEDLLGPTPPDRRGLPCPVSSSGRCLMDLIDTGDGPGPHLEPERYTPRQIRLLERFARVVRNSDPAVIRAFEVLLGQALRDDTYGPSPAR
ncbi:MAG: helix-turn-helix domain-containing protein [Acidobacteriota bacterium]